MKKTILVVDDEPSVRNLCREMIGRQFPKFCFLSASNGRDALALLSEHSVDILILDIVLPDIDGFDLCRQIRQGSGLQPKILMISGKLLDAGSRAKGLDAGADAYLFKPFESAELQSHISSLLRLREVESRLQTSLTESESYLRELIDNMSAGVAVYDVIGDGDDFIFADLNTAGERVSRVKRDDVVGRHLLDVFPEADAMGLVKLLREVHRTGAPRRLPLALYKDARIEQWVENYVYRLPSGRIVALYEDTTELRRAEEDQSRLQTAVSQAAEAIVITNTDGIIQYVNPAFEKVTGYSADEAIGGNPRLLKSGKHDEAFYQALWGTISAGDVWRGEVINKRKDGSLYTEQMTITPVKAGGKIINFIAIKQDVTNQRRVERAVVESEHRLRELTLHLQSNREEERTRLAREIHDELGQALSGIKMDVSRIGKILDELPQSEAAEELNAKVLSANQLIDETIQSVRRICTDLRPGVLDDLGLTAAMEWQVKEFAERSGIKSRLEVNAERVHFDEVTKTQLFRILQESLTNVLRHSGATEVLVSLRCGEDLGFMEVQDNGKGLSEERAGSGKSFGLVGMEERALLLGGKLVVQSSLSRGTLVQVVFPISNKGREEEVDGD